MTELGIGIIGCGNISTAYLQLSPLFKGLENRAVADINMGAAEAQANAFGVKAQTVEEILENDDVDVIVNLTIPAAHFAISKQALEAGKHVYSEKPFVLSLEEGEELRRLSASKSLRVGSAPDTFLGGAHQLARAKLDEGLIGDIAAGTCHVMSHGPESWHPNPDFFYEPGAGPMLDLGPYYLANLINLIGPVKRVAALTSSPLSQRLIGSGDRKGQMVPVLTPSNLHALLDFESGATVTLSTSWDVWAHKHGNMELYGTDGTMILPDPNFFGGTLEAAGPSGELVELDDWEHPFGIPNQDHNHGKMANYRTAGLADMAQAIGEGRDHRCSMDRALHAVEVMTSVIKSGETGEFVQLSTTCTRPDPLGIADAQALMK